MKHLRIVCLVFALLGLSACHPKSPASGASAAAVASVNGVPITRQFYDAYIKMISGGRTSSDLTPRQRALVLDGLIRAEAVAQQADKDGLNKEPHTQAMLELARLNILEQALSDKYLADHEPTDTDLKTVYDQQVAKFPKEEYHARHILLTSKAEAEKVIKALDRDHGRNFAALAMADSIDPSKDKGGDLGWFPLNGMVKPFSDAVASLKVGQITQTPVQTQFGWHVIQLLGTRPMTPPSFEDVKPRLMQAVENDRFRSYSDTLIKNAKVETYLDTQSDKLTAGVSGAPIIPPPSAPEDGG